MGMLFWNKCIKLCLVCDMICCLSGCGETEKADISVEQEIEAYMEEFVSMYMSEICGGEQRIYIQSKDVYADNMSSPVELIVYQNDREEDIRYTIQIYGETGNAVTDYYLCENFIYVNQTKEYYSSHILTGGYDDVLYRQTDDWIILGDEVYMLKDNGEMERDMDPPFFSIKEVKDWIAPV